MWRIISRDGLEQVSVRNVAREAGLSMGSLRHYFASQSQVLAFAMTLVGDRVGRRLAALEQRGTAREQAERALHELLPLDQERRTEAQVWLAFTTRALVDPALAQLHQQTYDALEQLCYSIVQLLLGTTTAPADDRVAVEADRLYAVIDGLTLHTLTRPERAHAQQLVAVVGAHLDALATPTPQRT